MKYRRMATGLLLTGRERHRVHDGDYPAVGFRKDQLLENGAPDRRIAGSARTFLGIGF